MRVPHTLLRDSVVIEDYGGAGARGAVYGAPRTVRASVQPTSQIVVDARGVTVPVEARVIIRPEAGPVEPESLVTTRGVRYSVTQSYPQPDERRPSHWELRIKLYSSSAA